MVVMTLILTFSGGCSSESGITLPESTSQPTAAQLPPTNTPVLVLSQNSSETVNLQVGGERVSLAIVQHGNAIPITVVNNRRGTVLLAPKPFTIRVEGDREATSIVALTPADETLLLSLEQSGRPVVAIGGTAYALYGNELRIFDPPLEFDDAPESFFTSDWWGASPEQATVLSASLESELGAAPIILFSGRGYLDDRSGESDFTIETINGVQPTEAETILIMVCLENWLGGTLGSFSQLEWFTFQVSFATR
jgi:hypothetical protein